MTPEPTERPPWKERLRLVMAQYAQRDCAGRTWCWGRWSRWDWR